MVRDLASVAERDIWDRLVSHLYSSCFVAYGLTGGCGRRVLVRNLVTLNSVMGGHPADGNGVLDSRAGLHDGDCEALARPDGVSPLPGDGYWKTVYSRPLSCRWSKTRRAW